MQDKHHTPETNSKISNSLKDKPLTIERRIKYFVRREG